MNRPLRPTHQSHDSDRPDSVELELVGGPAGSKPMELERDHGLRSLLELGRELSVSLDFYGIADVALFTLMGQLRVSKAALWIVPPDSSRPPVLLRSHGFRKQWVRAVGNECGPRIVAASSQIPGPMMSKDMEDILGPGGSALSEKVGISLFAPVRPRKKVFAIIALGHPLDQQPFTQTSMQFLQVSLGMIGVALENNGLYNGLLEKHRQVTAANQNLKELDRLKSEFLRNINHELRTPLTIIIAYMSFILDQGEQDTQKKELLDTVYSESLKLKNLLEKLLDFSSIHGEGLSIQPEPGQIDEFLTAYREERLPGVAESLHEFGIEIRNAGGRTRFDPQRLRQVLDVLVDNAVKFTPQGSRVTLRLDTVIEDGKAWHRIDLEDNGPGIPPDRLPHIFDSFRQGDGSMTRTVGGMGMGLAFAREVSERMGGRLEADSTPGEGARFSLYLPVQGG